MNVVLERIRHLAEDAGMYCTNIRSSKNLPVKGLQIHPLPYRDKHINLMPEAGTIVSFKLLAPYLRNVFEAFLSIVTLNMTENARRCSDCGCVWRLED